MAKQTLPMRALPACGAVAGPIYVMVTIVRRGLATGRKAFKPRTDLL